MTAYLDPLRHALDAATEPVTCFFRDDDVGWADERLFPLLDLFAAHGVPIDLAVIPRALTPSLARRLDACVARVPEHVGVHMHGFAHVNHEPAGRKCEFGPARDLGAQREDLERGRRRLADLLGDVVAPFFTPPWNRCTEGTGRLLVELGYRVLSRDTGAPALGLPTLREIPVGIDWLRRPAGAPRDPAALAGRIARAVCNPGPLGIMLHHEHMDAEERRMLGEVLALLNGHARARCRALRALDADRAHGEE